MHISIITINRNNSKGLERTVISVLKQTFRDFEYIIIDGASSDRSIEIIKSHEQNFSYWVSEPDNGIYNAMNKGIDNSLGDYCLFLNSGDEFMNENSLTDLYGSVNEEDIIYGNIQQNGNVITFPDVLTLYDLRWGSLPHPATLIKRKLFNTYGKYSEQYKIASDWEFWLKTIIIHNCSYKHLDRTIVHVEPPGLSAVLDIDEGYSILYSLFPKRVIDDYNRFKDMEDTKNNKMFKWIIDHKFLNKLIKLMYKYSGK